MVEVEVRDSYGEYRGKFVIPASFALSDNHFRRVEHQPFLKRLDVDVLHLKNEMMIAFILFLVSTPLGNRKERRFRLTCVHSAVYIVDNPFPLFFRRKDFLIMIYYIPYGQLTGKQDIEEAYENSLILHLPEHFLETEISLYIYIRCLYLFHTRLNFGCANII